MLLDKVGSKGTCHLEAKVARVDCVHAIGVGAEANMHSPARYGSESWGAAAELAAAARPLDRTSSLDKKP